MRKLVIWAAVPAALFLLSCRPSRDAERLRVLKALTAQKARQFSSYVFQPGTPLEQRLNNGAEVVLPYLRDYDNRKDYNSANLTEADKQTIRRAFAALPAVLRRNLEERLIGFFVLPDFSSSGYTEWILKQNKELYFFMAFSLNSVRKSTDDIIRYRTLTAFRLPKGPGGPAADVEYRTGIPAFAYILMHESSHAYDYRHNISPWLDDDQEFFAEPRKEYFSDGIWENLREPVAGLGLPQRKKISFYGLSGEPQLDISALPAVFRSLRKTPFPVLYGSQNRAEDTAEFISWYYLLKNPAYLYKVSVRTTEGEVFEERPFEKPVIRDRMKKLERILKQRREEP